MDAQEALKLYTIILGIIDDSFSGKTPDVSVNEFQKFIELGCYLQEKADVEKGAL